MVRRVVRKPDRDSLMPLWAQVLDDMRGRLASGEFTDGLPAERELIAQYDVSRHTMRDAMRRLHTEGLINRERGRGTFIRPQNIEQRSGALYSLFRSIEDQGFEQRSKVLELDERADPVVAAKLGVDVNTAFVYLHRLRNADNTPIATDELWIPAEYAAPLLATDFEHTAVYVELERQCGIRPGAGWERVHPVIPAKEERVLLGITAKVPAFLIERRTSYRGQPLEWRRTVVRGDLYTFMSVWSDTGEQRERPSFAPTTTDLQRH
jgi:GntR family transcriptional regulator